VQLSLRKAAVGACELRRSAFIKHGVISCATQVHTNRRGIRPTTLGTTGIDRGKDTISKLAGKAQVDPT